MTASPVSPRKTSRLTVLPPPILSRALALGNVDYFTQKPPHNYSVGKSTLTADDLMISGDDPRHVAMLMLTALCAYMENNEKEEVLTQSQLSAREFQREVLKMLGLQPDEKSYIVTVYWDAPLLEKGLVFYDLPGLGADNKEQNGYLSHDTITMNIADREAVAAIYQRVLTVLERAADQFAKYAAALKTDIYQSLTETDNTDQMNADRAVLCNAVQSLLCCSESVGVSIRSEKGAVRAIVQGKELSAFDAFRAEVLHEQIERKNRNGAPAVHGIARLCGFYSIYSDMLLWLAAMIPDGAAVFFFHVACC